MARAAYLIVVSLLVSGLAGCVTLPGSLDAADAATGAGGFSATHVPANEFARKGLFSLPLTPGAFAIQEPVIDRLTSAFDGVTYPVAVMLPDVPAGTRVPVIAVASPYFPSFTADALKANLYWAMYVERFVPHGFAVAYAATRGTADAEGCMDLMGEAERADVDQFVTWAGAADWSTGDVGLIGVSYDGSTPWMAAATGNPFLKTVVPIAGLTDVYSLLYDNGSKEFGVAVPAFYASQSAVFYGAPTPTRAACVQIAEWTQAATYTETVGGRDDPAGYWHDRNMRERVKENYRGSVFLVHGLQDWNVDAHMAYPFVNELAALGVPVKHLLGQWRHHVPDWTDEDLVRNDFGEVLLRWFTYWLKGDVTVDLGPVAQSMDSTGRWRSGSAWPPADAAPAAFALTADGGLVHGDGGAAAAVPVHADPTDPYGATFVATELFPDGPCESCPTFRSEPFDEPFRFAGRPTAHVTVTPSTPNAELAAYLFAEDASGAFTRLGWTQMNVRYAAGGDEPAVVTPGQPVVMRMQFGPVDAVVPAGSRLVASFGLGTFGDHLLGPQAPVMLHVGGDVSVVTVSAFTAPEGAFFAPPKGIDTED